MQQIIFGILRHLLTFGGGAGMVYSDNELMTVASIIVTVIGIIWSVINKNVFKSKEVE